MKEKTKQILRYVACGLGGLALGIGLLGGLSMCATSNNATSENVNTILSTERVRHNEQITTTEGGYTGYRFSLDTQYPTTSGRYSYTIYLLQGRDFTPNRHAVGSGGLATNNRNNLITAIESAYAEGRTAQMDNPSNRFLLAFFAYANPYSDGTVNNQIAYITFIEPNYTGWNSGYSNGDTCFLMTSGSNWENKLSLDYNVYTAIGAETLFTITNSKTSFYCFGNNITNTTLTFQDVRSFYREQGYTSGHQTGYEEGYDDAYAEKDTGIAFTSCGVYPNAHVTLQTDETIGNFKYMYLCHYITKPGYDEHTIYIMWTTNANTGQYLGEVIDRNDSDSYDPAVTLGSFTQEVTPSVTITATEDIEFGLWVGYITTFHNRGEVSNSILWFQGGTSESDLQIYQNGYDEGYQNGNQAGQQTGYDQGYERGQEVGDAEGYSRGYTEGFNQTNTKNVFSLFTSAFDSVASFFELKIFGFLPLYWFFLAPLFIALITLLMRMVKH